MQHKSNLTRQKEGKSMKAIGNIMTEEMNSLAVVGGLPLQPNGAKTEDYKQEQIRQWEEKEKRKRIEVLRQFSGLDIRFSTRKFANFQETAGNKKALKTAKGYAQSIEKMLSKDGKPPEIMKNGLFIAGNFGTGKTHLAAAIANEVMAKNHTAICMTMIDMLQKIKTSFDSHEQSEEEIMAKYKKAEWLIIDDLGSEQPTEWAVTKIFAIINGRYEACMPTIITTNCSEKGLIDRLTPKDTRDQNNAKKIIDRLYEMCVAIEIQGESWRR